MSRIVVINHLTLDGVMQAPGRQDEDTRDGFQHGGWSPPYGDAVMSDALGARMAQSGGLLLGRRTYLDLLSYWNSLTDSPFADALNSAPKFIASTTLEDPLPWPNSTLLEGDLAGAVKALKDALLIHPLVLGSGRRLFPEGTSPARLRLVDSLTTTTGVIIATYQPA
jgi:dihydrofolate reductase